MNNISYEVKELPDKTKGVVHLLNENKVRVAMYNVDLVKKTCDCHHYQQSGVPCYHAIALIRHLRISLNRNHFHDFCLDSCM